MAWRLQRGDGITAAQPRQVNRPVYEDFQPQIDTNEEEGAQVVVFRLPGFLKEQLKITAEHENNITVHGERPLMNNRRSRFNQLLLVPENCDVKKIHAKFHNGILTITMPKEVPQAPIIPPKVEKPAEKATQENVNKPVPPKTDESKVVPPSSSEPSQKAVAAAEPRAQKGQGRTPQTVASSTADKDEKQRDEKKMAPPLSPPKGIVEPKRQKGTVEEQTSAKQREDKTKERVNEKLKEPEKAEEVEERSLDKEKEYTQNGKESSGAPAEVSDASKILGDEKKATGKIDDCAACEQTPKDDGETSTNGNKHGIKYAVETAKQTKRNVVRKLNDENRQMLINIGAAVLVIVALGAYVSYSLRSSARRGN